jgi:hypothetical protein
LPYDDWSVRLSILGHISCHPLSSMAAILDRRRFITNGSPCTHSFWTKPFLRGPAAYLPISIGSAAKEKTGTFTHPHPSASELPHQRAGNLQQQILCEWLHRKQPTNALRAEPQSVDVLILHSLVWPKQKDDFYIVATRKLTAFSLKSSRDHPITRRSCDALVLSI